MEINDPRIPTTEDLQDELYLDFFLKYHPEIKKKC